MLTYRRPWIWAPTRDDGTTLSFLPQDYRFKYLPYSRPDMLTFRHPWIWAPTRDNATTEDYFHSFHISVIPSTIFSILNNLSPRKMASGGGYICEYPTQISWTSTVPEFGHQLGTTTRHMPQGVGWRSQIGFFNGHLLWSPLFFLCCHTLNSFFFPKKLFCIFYGKPLKMCQKICDFLFLGCWLSWDGSLIWLIFLWKHSLDFHSKKNQLNSSVGKYIPIFDTIKEHSHMTSYVLGLFLTYLLKYGNQILTLLH